MGHGAGENENLNRAYFKIVLELMSNSTNPNLRNTKFNRNNTLCGTESI